MSFDECKSKHTYRQMIAWNRWLDEQMNNPGALEHYVMQLTGEIQNVMNSFWWVKSKRKPSLDKLKIKFTRGKREPEKSESEMTDEEYEQAAIEQMNRSKSVWGAVRDFFIRRQQREQQGLKK